MLASIFQNCHLLLKREYIKWYQIQNHFLRCYLKFTMNQQILFLENNTQVGIFYIRGMLLELIV